MTKHFKTKDGYTIIETMISVSLFIVVIMAGMGALLNANLLHQKSQNLRSIMDNLSFVMEDVSRNLRTGTHYHCFAADSLGNPVDLIPIGTDPNVSIPKSCARGWAIAFESGNGSPADYNDQWVYYILNGKIFKSTSGPYAQAKFYQLTPDEIVIDSVSRFAVLGAEATPGDLQQPLVSIRLVGKITYRNVITPFSIQTSVSQRAIDI